jgi:hypothetical protein
MVNIPFCLFFLTFVGAMLYLLHWKEMPKQKLPDILNRVTYIHTVEILKVRFKYYIILTNQKFLRELFDSMFAILDSNGMDSIGMFLCFFLVNNLFFFQDF